MSDATKAILDKFGTFKVELRGQVELKGKGSMITHWLIGCTEPDPRPPTPPQTHIADADTTLYPLLVIAK